MRVSAEPRQWLSTDSGWTTDISAARVFDSRPEAHAEGNRLTTEQWVVIERARLQYTGTAKLGMTTYEWMRCYECGASYPVIDGQAKCNGAAITKCPYCRPDSEPWKYGRGL